MNLSPEGLITVASGIFGIFLIIAQWRSYLPPNKTRLKQDLDIYNQLKESDIEYALVKSHIESQLEDIYKDKGAHLSKRVHWLIVSFMSSVSVFYAYIAYTLFIKGGFWFMTPGIFMAAYTAYMAYDSFVQARAKST